MRNGSIRWYKSKIDWWLAPLLMIPPIAALWITAAAFWRGNGSEIAVGCGAMLWVLIVYAGVVFPTRYGIGNGYLTIRYGICRQRIPLAEIRAVCPTRNPLSSPALSLDRLRVRFGEGFFKSVMISPAERDEFLHHLASAAGLQQDGDRLTRSSAPSNPGSGTVGPSVS
ncbi:MAG: hypothetical protein RI963_2474 [Planctomycetota bacterium]